MADRARSEMCGLWPRKVAAGPAGERKMQQSKRMERVVTAGLCMVLVLGAGLMLSACRDRHGLSNVRAVALNDPERRHRIGFSSTPEVLFVEIPGGGAGLTPGQKTDVYRFVRRYKAESTDALAVSTPRRMRHHLAAREAVRDLEDILRENGIQVSGVQLRRHGRTDTSRPVLQLSYRRPVAVAPDCGRWPKDLGVDRERVHYENFGCATQRNFALTVGNARDIMGPQPEQPRSSARRDATWGDYIGGTSSSGGAPGGAAPAAQPAPTVQ